MDDNLASRVQSEKTAYNDGLVFAESSSLQRRFIHVFQCPNAVNANAQFQSTLAESIRCRFVLDYGCFKGSMIPVLSQLGSSRILGIDISRNAVAEAKQVYGGLADFCVMDGHRMALADESLDVVVGGAILHHLDFGVAIREIHRVLKPGGRAIFTEPLRGNPAARLIRLLTPKARTRYELPLSRNQILWADSLFSASHHFFSGLVSVGCGIVSSLVSENPSNAVMRLANLLDVELAKSPLKWWMRMVILQWTK